jgi:uncharacterized protein (DUF885 family)
MMTEKISTLSPVYQVASDYVDALAALDPVAATGAGIAGHETEMTDYSPDGYAAIAGLRRRVRAELDAAPVTNERDRIAADAMREHLDVRLALFDAQEHLHLAGSIGSPASGIRRVFDLMPRATAEDFERIAKRLALVPAAMESFEATLDEGIRAGKTGAVRQAEEARRQAKVYSGQEDGTPAFFSTLVEAFDAAGIEDRALRSVLERGAETATEAFAGFARYIDEQYMDGATTTDGVGRERYGLNARAYNGIMLDLDETYAWGWDELYRIEEEMRKTCARILPGASIEETKAYLESDPKRAIEGVGEFREWMQALQERTIDELDGVHFAIPGPVRKIEAMIAPPGGAAAMYYTGPSEDFSRPGRTWYPTLGKTRFPLWGEVSIAYHEGVPGHHFQIATTKYLAEELSRFQRLMGGTSGYVEGWALYAERLMGELGYLENPDYYLGMLRAQAMRAVRVIVDIGMHLSLPIPKGESFHGGETWTPELGDIFAKQRAQFPEDFMKSEVTRYLGAPGQAISYKVGERCWLEAREAAKQRRGSEFDLKAWHAAALNLGPMGLAQMQRELAVA